MFTIEIYGNANWECSYTMQAGSSNLAKASGAYVCELLTNLIQVGVGAASYSQKCKES